MEKSKLFAHAYFPIDVIKLILDTHFGTTGIKSAYYSISKGNETWTYDSEQEYFAEYRKEHDNSFLIKSNNQIAFKIRYKRKYHTDIAVRANTRSEIESVFEVFESNYSKSVIIDISKPTNSAIFIGHGRSQQWRDLKDHLTDKHGYKIEAYETGARAGQTIQDILHHMSSKSSFAILVMTGEDKDENGLIKARQNVIHEIGLFQGKLGFNKAIVLLEKGTEEFSNLSGIQQIRYSKGNIKETFGEVLATLRREFE